MARCCRRCWGCLIDHSIPVASDTNPFFYKKKTGKCSWSGICPLEGRNDFDCICAYPQSFPLSFEPQGLLVLWCNLCTSGACFGTLFFPVRRAVQRHKYTGFQRGHELASRRKRFVALFVKWDMVDALHNTHDRQLHSQGGFPCTI